MDSETALLCPGWDGDTALSECWESHEFGSNHSSDSEDVPQSDQSTKHSDCEPTSQAVAESHTTNDVMPIGPREDTSRKVCDAPPQPIEVTYYTGSKATLQSVQGETTTEIDTTLQSVEDTRPSDVEISLDSSEETDSADSGATVQPSSDVDHNVCEISLDFATENHCRYPGRPILKVLEATLRYPSTSKAKSAKLANDIVFFGVSAEESFPADGDIFWSIWWVVIDIARCVPEDHPWQDILVQALDTLRQREGFVHPQATHDEVRDLEGWLQIQDKANIVSIDSHSSSGNVFPI